MIGVGAPILAPGACHAFGGWNRASFGDLDQHGPDSIRFYTRTKTAAARLASGIKGGAQLSIPTMG